MKKAIALLIALIMILAAVPAMAVSAKVTLVRGDANGNGKIDLNDYAMVKRHVIGTYTLGYYPAFAADVNGNGKVDINDYAMIKRKVIGSYDLSGSIDILELKYRKLNFDAGYAVEGLGDITDSHVVIPPSYRGKPVVSIYEYAFSGGDFVTEVTIPDSVAFIESTAFDGTAIINDPDNWVDGIFYYGDWLIKADPNAVSGTVNIKEGTKYIAYEAFEECYDIKKVVLPDSMIRICPYAFANCICLETAELNDGLQEICMRAFNYCGRLENVTIPESVVRIGSGAFEGTEFMDQSKYWQDGAMIKDGCLLAISDSLEKYDIPDGIRAVAGELFFSNDSIKEISFPGSLKVIPEACCQGAYNLKKVTIAEGAEVIDGWAFCNCIRLESVVIGSTVKYIGHSAFFDCGSLQTVYFTGTEEQWNAIDVSGSNEQLLNANVVFNYKP